MEIVKFKTNIENQEDLSVVTPFLDKEDSISKWNIDTDSTQKVLSVSGTGLDPQTIINAVEEAGYSADIIRVMGISDGDL